LTWTTRLGGKAGWAPAARLSLKTEQAVAEKALAPLGDDLPRQVNPSCDGVIAEAFGGKEYDLGPGDFAIR
jgi:hypothetical protein